MTTSFLLFFSFIGLERKVFAEYCCPDQVRCRFRGGLPDHTIRDLASPPLFGGKLKEYAFIFGAGCYPTVIDINGDMGTKECSKQVPACAGDKCIVFKGDNTCGNSGPIAPLQKPSCSNLTLKYDYNNTFGNTTISAVIQKCGDPPGALTTFVAHSWTSATLSVKTHSPVCLNTAGYNDCSGNRKFTMPRDNGNYSITCRSLKPSIVELQCSPLQGGI